MATLFELTGEALTLQRQIDSAAEFLFSDDPADVAIATATLEGERTRLAALAAEKQRLLASTETSAASTADRLRSLGDSARSLRELLERAARQAEALRLS